MREPKTLADSLMEASLLPKLHTNGRNEGPLKTSSNITHIDHLDQSPSWQSPRAEHSVFQPSPQKNAMMTTYAYETEMRKEEMRKFQPQDLKKPELATTKSAEKSLSKSPAKSVESREMDAEGRQDTLFDSDQKLEENSIFESTMNK